MKTTCIVVTDQRGVKHEVYAAKPKCASLRGDDHLLTVVHDGTGSYQPYVVHSMNLETGGFYDGAYCSDLVAAMAVFNRR